VNILKTILLFLLINSSAHALVELRGNYSYSQQIYGANGDSSSVSETLSGTIAFYLWSFAALEFMAAKSEDRTIINDQFTVDGVVIESQKTTQRTNVAGVGLRFALADKNARIVPNLSMGYAKQMTDGEIITVTQGSGQLAPILIPEQEIDSSYIALSLRFRLSKLSGITVSGKTIVPGTDFDKANENAMFMVGLSFFL
jgi:hypothetical protein